MQRQLGTSLQGRSLRLGVAPREGYHLHLISILDKVLTAVNSGGGLGCDEMGMNAAKQVLRRRSYQHSTPSNRGTARRCHGAACIRTSDCPKEDEEERGVTLPSPFISTSRPRSKAPLTAVPDRSSMARHPICREPTIREAHVCLVASIRPSPLGKLSFVGLVAESRRPQDSSRLLASSWCVH
ncbi:hypothetical protein HDV57DRAFT_89931 [Trichoderma longibrachiatum]|uniref:Uncharacterized protein n=1 Tax=Trichoderma longibrachiatum ATCC 18648 TaxID=983965 RepID=A0A2T4BT89_TRILO|nr:hypothetical protein M440DRAFT_1433751 [Trichoderma longibrachiatum ATCC 18648]